MKHATQDYAPLNSRPPPDLFEVVELVLRPEFVVVPAYDPTAHHGPCHDLMRAVLQDAIKLYQDERYLPVLSTNKKRARQVQHFAHEAAEWFANRDPTETMSFEHICQVLDLDPDHIRKGLRSWMHDTPLGTIPSHSATSCVSDTQSNTA